MLLLWVVVIVCIVAVPQGRDRTRRLEETVAELRRAVDRLSRPDDKIGPPAERAPSPADIAYAPARERAQAEPEVTEEALPLTPQLLSAMADATISEPGEEETLSEEMPAPPSAAGPPPAAAPTPAPSFDWEGL